MVMVRVHRIRPFHACHSLSMGAAVQCILVAWRHDSRDIASRRPFVICIKLRSSLFYANHGCPTRLAASRNSRESFKNKRCRSKIKTDSATAWIISHLKCLHISVNYFREIREESFPNEPPYCFQFESWEQQLTEGESVRPIRCRVCCV